MSASSRILPPRTRPIQIHSKLRRLNGGLSDLIVHLVNGTYELFCHFYGKHRFN